MVSDLSITFRQKILLSLIEVLIKILWFIDKISSLNVLYILKTFFRSALLFISISFLVFLGYSISTGYLHDLVSEILVPYYPSQNVSNLYYPLPRRIGSFPEPEITAKSAIAIDRERGKVLFEKNPDEKLAPASTVKLMTALVSLDLYSLDEVLTAPEFCTQVEGTKAWFPKDISFKVIDLINSMLVGSAGDSACTLANSKITESEFVERMNEKASEIGMDSTIFSNPIGLDNVGNGHYSTVLDLYKLSVYATNKSEIKEIVSKKNFFMVSIDDSYKVYLPNTNRFLWEIPNSIGVKTGTTEGAGEVLIFENADDFRDILIVVMGSKDRFNDTRMILNWINQNYSWVRK